MANYPATLLTAFLLLTDTSTSSALPEVYQRSPRGRGGGGSSGTGSSSNGTGQGIGSWFAQHKALIIGVGSAVVVVIGLLILLCCLRRRKKKKHYMLTQGPGSYNG